jgi:uncharacterized protein (TIGR02145 family)
MWVAVAVAAAMFAFAGCGGNDGDEEIAYGSLTDTRDGKTYKTVKIGSQTWMAENLDYDTLNGTDSWCYDGNSSNCATYGRLYTWDAAMNLSSSCQSVSCSGQIQTKHRGVCPTGWHIPTNAEWTTLVNYVGGSSTGGTKLKTSSWGGTNDYGFSALPGGNRRTDGSFYGLGSNGGWWTATEYVFSGAYDRYVFSDYPGVGEYYDFKGYGCSVRCLQD